MNAGMVHDHRSNLIEYQQNLFCPIVLPDSQRSHLSTVVIARFIKTLSILSYGLAGIPQ